MSREVFKISDTTGSTRFLSLAVNDKALYSLDGISWVPLLAPSEGSIEYSFGYGLAKVDDTIVVDSSVVATLVGGKIPLSCLPELPVAYGNGLSISVAGVLQVSDPNTPGNIVVLPDTGKLPDSILPDKPTITYEYDNGIRVLSDLSLSVTDANIASRLVVLDDNGKIPSKALPSLPTGYGAGLGIDTTGNLTVVESNVSGRIVVVPDTGVLPSSILPEVAGVEYGDGLTVSDGKVSVAVGNGLVMDTAGKVAVKTGTSTGEVPVIGESGKLPSTIIPFDDPVEYIGGEGIEVVGNVISEIWKDYT